MFIPDPGSECSHPGSRIRIKEFEYFNPKKWFLSSRKYDPGCSFRIPDPDPLSRIPDPNCSHPGSMIRIKEFEHFNPKQWFLSSRKYDPGCSSRIPDPDPDLLPIPDPRVKKATDPGSGSATLVGTVAACLCGWPLRGPAAFCRTPAVRTAEPLSKA